MARFLVSTAVALAAGTPKTAIRVNTASSRKVILRRVVITDRLANAGDEGIRWRIMTGGTDGSGTSQAPTPLNGAAASQASAKVNYSGEPASTTDSNVRGGVPAGGGIDISFEGEDGLQVTHSSALALELTAAQLRGTGIVEATLYFEE